VRACALRKKKEVMNGGGGGDEVVEECLCALPGADDGSPMVALSYPRSCRIHGRRRNPSTNVTITLHYYLLYYYYYRCDVSASSSSCSASDYASARRDCMTDGYRIAGTCPATVEDHVSRPA